MMACSALRHRAPAEAGAKHLLPNMLLVAVAHCVLLQPALNMPVGGKD